MDNFSEKMHALKESGQYKVIKVTDFKSGSIQATTSTGTIRKKRTEPTENQLNSFHHPSVPFQLPPALTSSARSFKRQSINSTQTSQPSHIIPASQPSYHGSQPSNAEPSLSDIMTALMEINRKMMNRTQKLTV